MLYCRLYVVFLLLSAIAGCSKLSEPADTIRFAASICGETRTSMAGSTASFTSGDNIGVFETLTGRSNVPYTYNGTSWGTTTPMYWRDGTSNHTFYVYYPYTATSSGLKTGIPVLSGQTITTTPSAALDLLVAGPLTQKRSAGVALTFTHAYAMIQLNIKIGVLVLNTYTLTQIAVQAGNTAGNSNRYGLANITGNPAQVGYDFSANAIWAATNNTLSYTQSISSAVTSTNLVTTAITYYILVLPGTYNNPAPNISINTLLLGLPHNFNNVSLGTTTFNPGTKYVYNVTIGVLPTRSGITDITISPQEIVRWGDITIEQPLQQQ